MNQPADFKVESRDKGQAAVLTGDWTAVSMGTANERLEEALHGGRYLEVTQQVLHEHGALWFNDEAFVVVRRRDA